MEDNKKTLEELVVEFDDHELANEYAFSELESRVDEVEYKLDQTDYDDLESRLTETEYQLAGLADKLGDLSPIDVSNYFDNLFVRTKQLE